MGADDEARDPAAAKAGTGEAGRPALRQGLLRAAISTIDGKVVTPCLVSDLCEAGARLTLKASIPLGPEFRVAIPTRRISRWSRLIWRQGDQAGLAFLQTLSPPATPDESPEDAEIRALRNHVADLRAEIAVLRLHADLRGG